MEQMYIFGKKPLSVVPTAEDGNTVSMPEDGNTVSMPEHRNTISMLKHRNTVSMLKHRNMVSKLKHLLKQGALNYSRTTCAIAKTSADDHGTSDGKKCQLPNLDPFRPYVVKSIKPIKSIDCSGRLFTEYKNNVFRLLDDVNEGLFAADFCAVCKPGF